MRGKAIERWLQLGWVAMMTAASSWCTYQTLKPTIRIWWPVDENNDGTNNCRNRFNEKNPDYIRTMCLTSLTSLFFTVALLIYLAAYLIFMDEVGWLSNTARSIDEWTAFWVVNDLYIISLFIQFMGYASLLCTMFIRLTQVFSNTKYMIDELIIRYFYIILVVCILFVSVLFYVALEITFKGYYLIFIPALIYIAVSIKICYQFYNSMDELIQHNNKNSGDLHFSISMMDISLRITLLNIIALGSTCLLFLITFISVPISFFMFDGKMSSSKCLNVSWEIMAWLNNLDLAINNFTLLCSLRSSIDYFHYAFGFIFQYWKKRLILSSNIDIASLAQPELVPNNSDTIENADKNVRMTRENSKQDSDTDESDHTVVELSDSNMNAIK